MQKWIAPLFLLFLSTVEAQQPPVLPTIDPAMKTALRNIYIIGRNSGNRPAVFAKVGDSITANDYFVKDIGCRVEVLADHGELRSTISYFRQTAFPDSYTTAWCGNANSFSRDSIASYRGWTAVDPMIPFPIPISACPPPNNTPLLCELSLLRPSVALVMYGTNDLEFNNLPVFRRALTRVVREILQAGTVPVLSTIPPRLDNAEMGRRVGPHNQVIREVADTLQVPLWNYWLALQGPRIINHGIDHKGVHPNVYNRTEANIFTSEALRYGYNQRNLTAVQVLRKIKAVIQSNFPADTSTKPNFALSPGKLNVSAQRATSLKIFIKAPRNNFTAPIQLALEGPPAGITGTFVWNASGSGATLTLQIRSGVAAGEYDITVRGTSGVLKRTTSFSLQVS